MPKIASAGFQRSGAPVPEALTPYSRQVEARNCAGPPAPAELTAPSCVQEGAGSRP